MLNLSQTDCRNGGIAFAAGEDLSLKAGYLVKLNSGKDLILPTSDQDVTPYAVTQGADQGYLCGAVPLSSFMNARVVLDGTCEAGTLLVAKGDGRVTAYTAGSAARVIGVAEEKGVAGQHVLLRPVSIGVKGADGADGADGAAVPAGADGAPAGLLKLPKAALIVTAEPVPEGSLVGYCVFMQAGEGITEWVLDVTLLNLTELTYVVVGDTGTVLTLLPVGGNATCNVPHTMAFPTLIPAAAVTGAANVTTGSFLGPVAAGETLTMFSKLTCAASSDAFVGHGTGCVVVLMDYGGNYLVKDGGGVAGGT